MIRLHQIIILSVFILLRCCSSWAREGETFVTSISPSEVEGDTLEIPLGQLSKVAFTVRYIPSGIEYRPGLQMNGRNFNIRNHEFLGRQLLSIVHRSCNDSDKPGERCELLQVTVNGTNKQILELNGTTMSFLVFGAHPLSSEETSGAITLRIVDRPDPVEPITTKPETTTEVPVATTKSTLDVVDPNARIDQCEPVIVERVLPWVFVAILAALLFLTIVILILVICKYRNRQGKQDIESGSSMDAIGESDTSHRSNCYSASPTSPPANGDRGSSS